MIRFDDVTFSYDAGRCAVSRVSLSVQPGRILAVAGPNGSGKSTLALLADGLLIADTGRVLVDGLDPSRERDLWAVRQRVGIVFQNPDDQIVGALVEEDTAFGPENLGVPREVLAERVAGALAAVGLTGLERREPHLLSEGQKQRLAVAGALAMEPAYMVFDEPTALLDPIGRRTFADIVTRSARADGRGVMLVTHRPSEIALADRVIVMGDGAVVWDGEPAVLLADVDLMVSVGLAPSPLGRVVAALRVSGHAVPPTAQDPSAVVAALWP